MLLNHSFIRDIENEQYASSNVAASMNNLDTISLIALRIKNKDVIVLDSKDP